MRICQPGHVQTAGRSGTALIRDEQFEKLWRGSRYGLDQVQREAQLDRSRAIPRYQVADDCCKARGRLLQPGLLTLVEDDSVRLRAGRTLCCPFQGGRNLEIMTRSSVGTTSAVGQGNQATRAKLPTARRSRIVWRPFNPLYRYKTASRSCAIPAYMMRSEASRNT